MTTALDATDLNNLRGTGAHTYTGFLAVVPQTVFATARINQASFARPLMQITVDTTSADWLDVLPGMTVHIGTTAGASDVGIFRVRETPGASTLYINEMSTGDFGMVPSVQLRPLADNQYITIIGEHNKHGVFSAIRGGVIYKDGDNTYSNQNETGGAVPGVVNIGQHVQSSINPTEITASFTATAHAFDGSVSSYAWDFGDGDPATATGAGPHSVDFPEGNRWISCAVTFSGGAVVTAYRHVWAFGATNQPYYLASANSRKSKQGRRMTCRVLGTAYNTNPVRLGAMVMYFESTRYNNTATIASAASQFVGWVTRIDLRGEKDGLHEYELEIESGLELASKMRIHGQQWVVSSNPTHWQEITANLSHLDFVVYYLLHYHTTLARLFDYQRSTLTGYTAPSWKTDSGNVTGEINRLCARLNMTINQDSDGTMLLVRKPAMLETSTLRNALVTRMTLAQGDVKNVSFSRNIWPQVGMVQANGFNSTTDHTQRVALKAYAPGQVPGQGAGVNTLDNQLVGGGSLGAQEELNNRASNQWIQDNRALDTFTVDFVRGNYENVFEPSQNVIVELSLAASYSPTGEALSVTGEPLEVSITYNPDGTKNSSMTFEPLMAGYTAPAQTIPVVINDEEDLDDITWPPYDDSGLIDIPYDPFGPIPPIAGIAPDPLTDENQQNSGYLIAWGDDGAGITRTPALPQFTVLHQPSGETVIGVISNPRSPKLTSNPISGALLGWVVTDAALYYSTNMLLGVPVFATRQTFTDFVPETLRAMNGVSGGVAISGNNNGGGTWSQDFDFTDNDGGWIPRGSAGPGVQAIYSAGNGWQKGTYDGGGGAGETCWIRFDVLLTSTFTSASFTFTASGATDASQGCYIGEGPEVVADLERDDTLADTPGATLSWTGTESIDDSIHLGVNNPNFSAGSVTITSATFTGTGSNPFTGESGDDSKAVIFSSNTGTTITTRYFGDSQDGQGFDVSDFSPPIFIAGSDDNLHFAPDTSTVFAQMATVDAGTAVITCVRIPQRQLTSTSLNNSATALHFIVGYDGDNGSSRTLERGVFNSSANSVALTNITITHGGNRYHVIGPDALECYAGDSRVILALATENGETQIDLFLSTNGGTGWTLVQTDVNYTWVRWATSQAAWFGGADGIGFTPDRGTTIEDRTGDFAGAIADLPIRGAYGKL